MRVSRFLLFGMVLVCSFSACRKIPEPEAVVASSVTGKNNIFCILGLFVEIVAPKCDPFYHTMYREIYSFEIIRPVRDSPFENFCKTRTDSTYYI